MRSSDVLHHLKSLISSPASLFLAAILLAIDAAMPSAGEASGTAVSIYETFGLRGHSIMQGWIWQFVTYALLHGGFAHVLINAAGLAGFGSRIEHILGPAAVIRICILGVLSGAIFHLIFTRPDASAPILVGFSGAVMALLLTLTTLSPDSRMWPIPVSGRSLGLGLLIAEGILVLIDPALRIPMLSTIGEIITRYGGDPWFEIAHACHFGGGLAGWLYARWILRKRINLDGLHRARKRREAKGN